MLQGYLWRTSQLALVIKNLPADTGDVRDLGSNPGLGRSSGGGHGNPLQYSSLENPANRGAWQAPVHRQSQTRLKRLSTCTHGHIRAHTCCLCSEQESFAELSWRLIIVIGWLWVKYEVWLSQSALWVFCYFIQHSLINKCCLGKHLWKSKHQNRLKLEPGRMLHQCFSGSEKHHLLHLIIIAGLSSVSLVVLGVDFQMYSGLYTSFLILHA